MTYQHGQVFKGCRQLCRCNNGSVSCQIVAVCTKAKNLMAAVRPAIQAARDAMQKADAAKKDAEQAIQAWKQTPLAERPAAHAKAMAAVRSYNLLRQAALVKLHQADALHSQYKNAKNKCDVYNVGCTQRFKKRSRGPMHGISRKISQTDFEIDMHTLNNSAMSHSHDINHP
jgi:hypothetical protein